MSKKWILACLLLFSILIASCYKSGKPPEEASEGLSSAQETALAATMAAIDAANSTPTRRPTALPTPTRTPSPAPEPSSVFSDVPGSESDVKYLQDSARLEQESAEWAHENGVMVSCEGGSNPKFCPQEPTTLVVFRAALGALTLDQKTVDEVIQTVFPVQTLYLEVPRDLTADVLSRIYYPEFECNYEGLYTDVSAEDRYACAIEALYHNHLILLEDLPKRFGGEYPTSRIQLVVWLYLLERGGEGLQ